MMSTLLKLGLSGYDVKSRFGAFQCEYLLQNPLFLGKNFGGTRHACEKNEPTLDHSDSEKPINDLPNVSEKLLAILFADDTI